MTLSPILATTQVVIEYPIKIVVLGTVPENHRPSSSIVQLLLISLLPPVGLPLYLLIGSLWVHDTRRRQQHTVNEITLDYIRSIPDLPKDARPSTYPAGALHMNHWLTGLPYVNDEVMAIYADPRSTYEAVARTIDPAIDHVHVEFYIMGQGEVTDVFFAVLEHAMIRGVTVHPLLDHLDNRKHLGWKQFCQRMTDTDIHWCLMMPLLPLKHRQRRPGLRNHRKILVIDDERDFAGSHNVIDSLCRIRRNVRAGHRWEGPPAEVTGEITLETQVVFAMGWLFKAGEQLGAFDLTLGTPTETLPEMVGLPGIPVGTSAPRPGRPGAVTNAIQLISSGPGYPTESSLWMLLVLIHGTRRHVPITSPYFIPDEAPLATIASAVYRGVEVELLVGKESDQSIVSHAQCSCYSTLLMAGVRIYLYSLPIILHSKCMTVDDEMGVIGSSNMDFHSFALDYEVTLLTFGRGLDDLLHNSDTAYRATCTGLTPELQATEPWYNRYVDNAYRLMSAVLQQGRGQAL